RRTLIRAGAWSASIIALATTAPLAAASGTPAQVVVMIAPGATPEDGSLGMSFTNTGGTDYTGTFDVRYEPSKVPVMTAPPVLVDGQPVASVRKIDTATRKFFQVYTLVLTIPAGTTIILPFQWIDPGVPAAQQSRVAKATAPDSGLVFTTSGDLT